jgi:signal transduction histidine kinase
MKLKMWYKKNVANPLLLTIPTIVLLIATINWIQLQSELKNRQKALQEVAELATLVLLQQNRVLLETTLNMAVNNLKIEQVLVCDNNQVLYSHPNKVDECIRETSHFYNSTKELPAIGLKDTYFIFSFSWLNQSHLLLYPLLALILLPLAFLTLTQRLKKLFEIEILLPLSTNSNGSTPTTHIDEIKTIIERKQELEEYKVKSAVSEALTVMAAQVSHDIRSPLTALVMVTGQIDNIPENQRTMIRSSVQRITDISNELLQKSRQYKKQMDKNKTAEKTESDNFTAEKQNYHVELLAPIIDSLVSEKRVQYRDRKEVEIEGDINLAYGLFALLNATEFKRVLSNLVNNAVESFVDGKGRVVIAIRGYNSRASIFVQDNGKGFSDELLQQIGEKGVSFGKDGTAAGSGAGVYHAKKTIEDFGGKFEILSRENVGTTISMHLDRTNAPTWFVESLKIYPQMQIISIDDDIAIHQIWKGRFESKRLHGALVEHLTFTSGIEFKTWLQTETQKDVNAQRIYLVDYELLNQNMTGLDIIEELKIGNQSILVTSRYEEENLRERCEKLGVKLIPKSMAACVPIEISQPRKKFDCILIDDDPLVEMAWELAAKKKGKTFQFFSHPDDFLAKTLEFDFDTPIFVDQYLGGSTRGDVVSKKFFELGFKNIILCTGADPEEFKSLTWIKQVRGKEPDFSS